MNNNGHPGQVFLIAQELFVLPMPLENAGDDGHPAFVEGLGVELGEPGAQALRDAVMGPPADLGAGLHGVFPAVRFFDPDAEDSADRLTPEGGPVLFAVFPIRPRRQSTTAGLLVGKEGFR